MSSFIHRNTEYTCDRCGVKAVGRLPEGWHEGHVVVYHTPFTHLCNTCGVEFDGWWIAGAPVVQKVEPLVFLGTTEHDDA